MKCESCHEHEAHIRVTAVINGIEKNFYLCRDCAKDVMENGGINAPGFDHMMKTVFNLARKEEGDFDPENMTEEEREENKELFNNLMEELFKQLAYIGVRREESQDEPIPKLDIKPVDEQTRLKARLIRAIDLEDYDEAAKLRDALEALSNH